MSHPKVRIVAAFVLGVAVAISAEAASAPLRGMAIEVRLSDPPLALAASPSLPLIVYLSAADDILTGTGLVRLEAHLAAYAARRLSVVLALGAFPVADADVDRWRQTIQSIAQQSKGRINAYEVGTVAPAEMPDVDRYAFLLKLAAVSIRAIDDGALVVQGTIPSSASDWQARVYAAGVAPYEDGVAMAGPVGLDDAAFQPALDRMLALVEQQDPTAQVI